MKTTTLRKEIEKHKLSYVGVAMNGGRTLKENEYFALMVTDDQPKNPRSLGIDANYHVHLIGLEKTGTRIYLSKDYSKRRNSLRGLTVVVDATGLNVEKDFSVL